MREHFGSVPDLLLERYALGELSPAEQVRLETRLANDPVLRERLDALRASNAALLETHAPEMLARRLQDRLRRENVEREIRESASDEGTRSAWHHGARPALAGLMVLALVAVPAWKVLREDRVVGTEAPGFIGNATPQISGEGSTAGPSAPTSSGTVAVEKPGSANPEAPPVQAVKNVTDKTVENPEANPALEPTRLKGLDPRLALFRKTDHGAEPMHPGEKVGPGQSLRIGYHAAGFDFGAIFSVDGNGNVTRHWPVRGSKAARLESGEVLLPNAFELDAAPAFERFYFVVATRPFELEPLLAPLHKGVDSVSALPLPAKARIVRFEILKESGI